MPAPALVLFDIDGTLIRRAGPHHREALVEAIRRTAHVETTTEGVPVAGISALDGALWDALGKASGLPLYRLLGGAKTRLEEYSFALAVVLTPPVSRDAKVLRSGA